MEKSSKSFLKLILSFKTEKATGALKIKKDQVEKKIYLKEGRIIFIDSALRYENLGRILLENGKISKEQFENLVIHVDKTQKRQGEALVELGYMTAYEVFEALKEQLGKKLLNCFMLHDFQYEFEGGDDKIAGVTEIPINDIRVIIDGVQTSYSFEILKEQGGFAKDCVPHIIFAKQHLLSSIKLKPEEVKLIRLFDGTHKLFDIAKDSGVDPQFVLSTAFVLSELGIIEYLEKTILKRRPKPLIHTAQTKETSKQEVKEKEEEKIIPKIEDNENVKETSKQMKPSIYDFFIRMDRLGYLELFGLSVKFKLETLKTNYENLLKKYQLDKIDTIYKGEDVETAERVFNRVVTAFTILKDEKKKDSYLKMRAKIIEEKPLDEDPLVKAEIEMNKALMFRKKGNLEKALTVLRKAIEYNPKEIEYLIALADVLMTKAQSDKTEIPEEVEGLLKQALQIDNNSFNTLLHLGIYHKIIGNRDKAINCFNKVLSISPNNSRASMELRLFNIRKDKKPVMTLFAKKPKKESKKVKEEEPEED